MRQSPRKQLRSDLQSASPSRNRKGGSSENESDNFESPRTKRLKRGAQAESLQREESEKSDQDSDQQEDDYDQFDGDDCVDEFGNCLQGNCII